MNLFDDTMGFVYLVLIVFALYLIMFWPIILDLLKEIFRND